MPRGYLPTLDGWRAIAILGVMVAHACAWPSYLLVERPMIRLGHRLAPPTTEVRA